MGCLLRSRHQLELDAAISPFLEMGAYEALWSKRGASFRQLADRFRSHPESLPSDFVPPEIAQDFAKKAHEKLAAAGVARFGVRVHGECEYPDALRGAENPIELCYYQGWWDLIASRRIAVIGSRNATLQGLNITRRLVRNLVSDGFTIISGLARGIDTAAHEAAIEAGGRTIAVLGTPLYLRYPPENHQLQEQLARDFLVISQVPVVCYDGLDHKTKSRFFPERNITMSALSEATVIVEAGDTSGALIQARHALKQGRKLFVLERNFKNLALRWPLELERLGATRVRDLEAIQKSFAASPAPGI